MPACEIVIVFGIKKKKKISWYNVSWSRLDNLQYSLTVLEVHFREHKRIRDGDENEGEEGEEEIRQRRM